MKIVFLELYKRVKKLSFVLEFEQFERVLVRVEL